MDLLYKISRRVLEMIQRIDPRFQSLILRLALWGSLVGVGLVITRNLPRRSPALQFATALAASFVALSIPVEQTLGVHRTAFGFAFLLCVVVLPFLPVWLSRLLVPRYLDQKLIRWGLYVFMSALISAQLVICIIE